MDQQQHSNNIGGINVYIMDIVSVVWIWRIQWRYGKVKTVSRSGTVTTDLHRGYGTEKKVVVE